jgi:signal transduction histidine kinase
MSPFRANATLFSFLPFLLISLVACSQGGPDAPDPKKLPYRLEKAFSIGERAVCEDLDRDGRDEIVRVFFFGEPEGGGNINLLTNEGRTIDQVNFLGKVEMPHFLDWDGDGTIEILVPFVRNDSLFLSVVDAQGRKIDFFFLISGKPRREDDAVFEWDPDVRHFYLLDVDRDGRKELVTVIVTSYARLPRGILIHSVSDGALLGKVIVGAMPESSFVGDFDGDGRIELMVSTVAPNNGAVAGGFDDQHSYLIVFELGSSPKVEWSREMGGVWTQPQLFYADFDGDGRKEFLVFTTTLSARPRVAELQLLEPGTWRVRQQRLISEPLISPQIVDLDRDARPEILVIRVPDQIWVFDGQFRILKQRRVALELIQLGARPDVDGDGVDELVAASPGWSLLLAPDLGITTAFQGGILPDILRRGIGNPPYLLGSQGNQSVTLRLVRNRYYLLYRYGPAALWGLGAAAVLGFVSLMVSQRRRNRVLQAVQSLALDTDDRGLLLLTPGLRIDLMNSTLRRWLGVNGAKRERRSSLDEALAKMPPLAEFLREATLPPMRRHETTLLLDLRGQKRIVRVVIDPVPVLGEERPHWLVCLEDLSLENEFQRARTWGMMAQRVAHDIKNPLTSILLTLQRLQMEYHEKAPELSGPLDRYAKRIIERVEYLRRVTRNFMKFVHVEKLNLTETDLNSFVRENSEEIRKGLPPDIGLELNLCKDCPAVRIDQEQMQSVLENLVSNAVNAMPEGGRVTISTQLAPALQFPPRSAPQDYVVLEVLDTGVGIPESVRERLFEPDFTSSESGTGLGLAIVKKIVEDHGGHIEVESEEGVGSAFSVYLPVVR